MLRMERALYILGAALGSVLLIINIPYYETDGVLNRTLTAIILFVTLGCIASLAMPHLKARDKARRR